MTQEGSWSNHNVGIFVVRGVISIQVDDALLGHGLVALLVPHAVVGEVAHVNVVVDLLRLFKQLPDSREETETDVTSTRLDTVAPQVLVNGISDTELVVADCAEVVHAVRVQAKR